MAVNARDNVALLNQVSQLSLKRPVQYNPKCSQPLRKVALWRLRGADVEIEEGSSAIAFPVDESA